MLKLINRDSKTHIKRKLTAQAQIEGEIAKIVNLGNIECAYLFSNDGLLMAGIQGRNDFDQNHALEVVYSVNNAFKFLKETSNFNGAYEILMISKSKSKISVRVFQAFRQQVSLVILVHQGKTYRSFTNRLIRIIQKISHSEIE